MIVTFEYPIRNILYPKQLTQLGTSIDHPYARHAFKMVIASLRCDKYERLERCNLQIFYNKRANKKNYIRKRYYFTHEELKKICNKIFSKYYLTNVVILNWKFIELEPSCTPKIIVKVIKI